jgi:Alginate lyase
LASTVDLLSMAYTLTEDETYATRAVYLLDYWFLNKATKMNPNLNYAQAEKGISNGTANGVIDTWVLPTITDAISLLRGSQAMTAEKYAGFQTWFTTYANWLQTSTNGMQAETGPNNHGSAYDLQVAGILQFLGDTEGAGAVVNAAKWKRVEVQIEGDGVEPLEVVRADSWGCSCLNIKFLTALADLGKRDDVNLWAYTASDGGSIQAAIDFLTPYGLGEGTWPYPEVDTVAGADLAEPLLRAAVAFKNPQYLANEQQLQATETPQLRVLEAQAEITLDVDAPK